MSSTGVHMFDHATHTARMWLAEVARRLGTKDQHAAYRALRAWLHTLRDRLPADAAADFAAQLPELFRGVYYDGWKPSRAPVKFGPDEYRQRFAREAQIRVEDVDAAACRVTAALRTRLSPGQVDQALALVAHPLRRVMQGLGPEAEQIQVQLAPPDRPVTTETGSGQERLALLEQQVAVLSEAVRVLVLGLEDLPTREPDPRRASDAASRAHELLMAPS